MGILNYLYKMKQFLLLLSLTQAINLGHQQKGSLLTDDMFDDVNPEEFKKELEASDDKESKGRSGAPSDGIIEAKGFDSSNWNSDKKADCYYKGFNNIIPDGLLHLNDGTTINCEDGRKVNPADF